MTAKRKAMTTTCHKLLVFQRIRQLASPDQGSRILERHDRGADARGCLPTCGHSDRRSNRDGHSSQRTRRWREVDSNPRSPGYGQPDFFCSASHSMEPIAHTVWVGCGLRRCSAAWACIRVSSKNSWPGNGRLNQSSTMFPK
jgi:hypothetical protein